MNKHQQGSSGHRNTVKRTIYISGLGLINAVLVGFIAKGLILLVNFFTHMFFYGRLSFEDVSPADNTLGYSVIFIPAIGGLMVGLMARFGAPAIRGHGIPEAMEKIAIGESRIHPLITILKPLSAAISIGSGGPFGAEGPIISTGGALGSFCGQTLHITTVERKILLAAGATSGMTAIFGTPFAAILLAIELLLFEFSGRSFIPVMIACVTGACMHFLLFSTAPTFPMPEVLQVTPHALGAYAVIGLIMGFASIVVTKAIYFIEDGFEKLPIHWMWWPAIGGLVVGGIGLFAPATLGVGYQNITNSLSGHLSVSVLISLCLWKFISWAISLGSGTSGGTLAPLLTIGSSLGCLLGMVSQKYFPDAQVILPMAALVGMAALFAGAARALLTSIVFAVETTMQESTLLPLMAGCVTAYLVSFIFMRTTIMTEKIKRRGVRLPDSYHPDPLEMLTVADILNTGGTKVIPMIDASETINDVRHWLHQEQVMYNYNTLLVHDPLTRSIHAITKTILHKERLGGTLTVGSIASSPAGRVYPDNSLQLAVELMLKTEQDILPVVERKSQAVMGMISEHDILKVFEQRFRDENDKQRHISLKGRTLQALNSGKNLFLNKKE